MRPVDATLSGRGDALPLTFEDQARSNSAKMPTTDNNAAIGEPSPMKVRFSSANSTCSLTGQGPHDATQIVEVAGEPHR